MAKLLDAVASWQTLLVALALYGFAPGFVLRLLVRLYPKQDPRRTELVAELYAVPRLSRPFWVADALAAVLIEGLPRRIKAVQDRRREKKLKSARKKDATGREPKQEAERPYPSDEGREAAPRGWGLPESHLLPDAVAALVDDELTLAAQNRASAHLTRCQACAFEVATQRHRRSPGN
ncbi:hypothetical protein [Amycolatopsis sp. cmx-8-4]|uniref:hypothetical protein n=1 Tax=Amycolatopsis sp. cmx-8-4 TaxID=2790947 RepID=UPI003979D41E